MKVLRVYLAIYAGCFRKAFAAVGRNAWTLLLPLAAAYAYLYAARLVAPLGLIGGFVMALVLTALASSYLYFVGELVQAGRVSLKQLRQSIGAYFWSVMNVLFVFWLASLVLSLLVGRTPAAAALLPALWLVALVALNVVPEVIYLRGSYGGMQTITASWEFLKAHWIPWFAINVPLLALVAVIHESVPPGYFLGLPLAELAAAPALHLVMVFRGHLFRALDGSSHRQRMFMQRVA